MTRVCALRYGWPACLITVLAMTCPAPAADVPFTYRKGGIPDFDQRRDSVGGHYGLPFGGVEYCVPTSAMNCLAYIANHGYGWMEPYGYIDWSQPSQYDAAGIEIFKMGDWFMNTVGDPNDANPGTTGANHVQGIKDWFDSWGALSDFTVTGQFASGATCPSPDDLANAALGGGLVMPIIGWYSLMGGAYARVGGHVVALNKLVGTQTPNGPAYTISWRDPGSDDGSQTSQSPFSTETYTLTPVTASFDGNNRTQYQVGGYASGPNPGFLDGFVVILPKFGLTSAPGDFEFDLYNFSYLAGVGNTVHIAALGGIQHAAFHPGMSTVAYVTLADSNSQSDLRLLDPRSASTQLVQSAMPGALALATSRHGRAYVLEHYGLELASYSLDPNDAVVYYWQPPQAMSAVAYDDLYDLVYVLAPANLRMLACPADLSTEIEIQLPGGLSMNPEAQMCVSPVTSNVWIASQWASALYELGVDENGSATLLSTVYDPDLAGVLGVSVDDRDHVFVSTDTGAGLEFAGGTGNWQRVSPSVLDGLTFGKVIQMSYTRSNFDPATMLGPGYADVLPTEFASPEYDATGDLNCDGAVNFGDINPFVVYLSNFGAWESTYPGCPPENGDINGDGTYGESSFGDINPFVLLLSGG